MIVVFGTINVDMVTVVPHLPVAGESVRGRDHQFFPGGKGANQAVAAARAGARVMLVGTVGTDAFAEIALTGPKAGGVDLSRVARSDRPTGLRSIAVDPNGQYLMIGAEAANGSTRAEQLEGLLSRDVTFVTQTSIGPREAARAIATARLAGARVIFNAAPATAMEEASFAACDVVVFNESEARGHAPQLGAPADFPTFARRFAARFHADCIVTLGGDGAVAARPDGSTRICRPPVVEVVDTTGAGDAFIGTLAAALDRDADLFSALREGLAAGSLACRSTGAQSSFAAHREIASLARSLSVEDVP